MTPGPNDSNVGVSESSDSSLAVLLSGLRAAGYSSLLLTQTRPERRHATTTAGDMATKTDSRERKYTQSQKQEVWIVKREQKLILYICLKMADISHHKLLVTR